MKAEQDIPPSQTKSAKLMLKPKTPLHKTKQKMQDLSPNSYKAMSNENYNWFSFLSQWYLWWRKAQRHFAQFKPAHFWTLLAGNDHLLFKEDNFCICNSHKVYKTAKSCCLQDVADVFLSNQFWSNHGGNCILVMTGEQTTSPNVNNYQNTCSTVCKDQTVLTFF